MELTHEFRVGVPQAQAWAVLTDVERIAPCLPGAQLQEVEGDEYRGVVKVKVGPITAQYKGKAQFVEKDEAAGRAVLRAEGRDTRGQGNANATITAQLSPDGDGTRVSVVTDLVVSGKVAQFGRGILADVSAKLLGQFVAALEADVLSGGAGSEKAPGPQTAASAPSPRAGQAAPGAGPEAAAAPAAVAVAAVDTTASNGSAASPDQPPVRRIEGPAARPVDLFDAAGTSVAKRAIPAIVALLVLLLTLRRRRGRRGRRG